MGALPPAEFKLDNTTKEYRFMRLLEPLQGALAGYCRRSLHDRNSIADVLQSAVANSYRDFHLYAEGTNFRAWMFQYVHFEIQNANRKHERTSHFDFPVKLSVEDVWELALTEPLFTTLLQAPDQILDQCDQELASAVLELPPLERAVILLRSIGEFKYREISDILHVPIGTVMSCLARARIRLRQKLTQHGHASGWLKHEERQA